MTDQQPTQNSNKPVSVGQRPLNAKQVFLVLVGMIAIAGLVAWFDKKDPSVVAAPLTAVSQAAKEEAIQPAATPAEVTEALKEAHRSLTKLHKAGVEMDAIRQSHDLSDIKQCGERMRKLQSFASGFEEELKKLLDGSGAALMLAAAANQVGLCVSCSRSLAMPNCGYAKQSLDDAATFLKSRK